MVWDGVRPPYERVSEVKEEILCLVTIGTERRSGDTPRTPSDKPFTDCALPTIHLRLMVRGRCKVSSRKGFRVKYLVGKVSYKIPLFVRKVLVASNLSRLMVRRKTLSMLYGIIYRQDFLFHFFGRHELNWVLRGLCKVPDKERYRLKRFENEETSSLVSVEVDGSGGDSGLVTQTFIDERA